MSHEIRAIETRYAGCRFRSRLEARWAVFFDEMDLEWQYEPETFTAAPYGEDAKEILYLPDFYLPQTGYYVEVKGGDEALAESSEKLAWMIDWNGPIDTAGRGLIILGDVGRPDARIHVHPALFCCKGIMVAWGTFVRGSFMQLWTSDDCNQETKLPEEVTTRECLSSHDWGISPFAYNRAAEKARSHRFGS